MSPNVSTEKSGRVQRTYQYRRQGEARLSLYITMCAHHLIRCKASKSCRAEDVRVVPVFDELVQTLAACNPGLLSGLLQDLGRI